jgi:hypothetical protein
MSRRAGWLATTLAAMVLISGCAPIDEDLSASTAEHLQTLVVSVAETAATGDAAAALLQLDALQQELDAAVAAGDVGDERAAAIRAAIDLVRADLVEASTPIPTDTPVTPTEAPVPSGPDPETDDAEDGDTGKGNGNGNGGNGNGNNGNGKGNGNGND